MAGDIDEATFRTAVFRTGLIRDDEVLAQVDEQPQLRCLKTPSRTGRSPGPGQRLGSGEYVISGNPIVDVTHGHG